MTDIASKEGDIIRFKSYIPEGGGESAWFYAVIVFPRPAGPTMAWSVRTGLLPIKVIAYQRDGNEPLDRFEVIDGPMGFVPHQHCELFNRPEWT